RWSARAGGDAAGGPRDPLAERAGAGRRDGHGAGRQSCRAARQPWTGHRRRPLREHAVDRAGEQSQERAVCRHGGRAPCLPAGDLATAGFDGMRLTEKVTGGRTRDAREWTELMAGAGPLPYTLIRSLGPRYRNELEAEVEAAMASLGDPDEAFRYHHSYVLAVARKR